MLDEVEGLGKFIEIEALAESEEAVGETVRILRKILISLGVKKFERRSYLELILEKEGSYGEAR